MNKRVKILSLVCSLALVPFAAIAHHSVDGTFDTDSVAEVEGVVESVLWRNPHIRIVLSATNSSGQLERWDIETSSLTTLRRRGVDDLRLDVGDTIRVAGNPARNDSNQIYVRNLLTADGVEVLLGRSGPRWSEEAIGAAGPGVSAKEDRSRPDLGIFRVWSTPIVQSHTYDYDYDFGLWNASYPLTAQAEAVVTAFNPATDAPTVGCTPKGMPSIMSQPYPMQLVEQDGNIVIRIEEYDTVRTIYLNNNEPAWSAPSLLGHSIGRWDGNTLIVETKGISWRHFNSNGISASEAISLVETFSAHDSGARLDYTMKVTDPAIFTEPVLLERNWTWLPEITVEPFNCVD